MFLSLSQHPGRLTCCLFLVCVVAFSPLFFLFLDAVAFIVVCRHARVCSGGWDGVGWGGVGGFGGVGGVGGAGGVGGLGGDDNVLVY